MTNKDFRELQNLLPNKDILNFAERMCKKAELDPEKDYPQTFDSPVIASAARRQLYLAKAANLMLRAIFLGASSLEVLRIAEYILVINKSIDKSLDYRGCEKGLKIQELEEKYSQTSLLSMDVPIKELKQVIDRDNDYYPVPIKENP